MKEHKLMQLQEERKRVHANKTIGKIAFNYEYIKSELNAQEEETFEQKAARIKAVAEKVNKALYNLK